MGTLLAGMLVGVMVGMFVWGMYGKRISAWIEKEFGK